MIIAIDVREQFKTAYNIIRANATSDGGGISISFPTFSALFDRETLIKECDPYTDLYDRATRVQPGYRHILMKLANFEINIHINEKNEITLLRLEFGPRADQYVAENIVIELQGIVKARVSTI